MSERVAEVYSVLVPLAEGRLLVPRTCVAEVISYQLPAQMTGAPPWYLGLVGWSGKQVPLVSFECLCGQPLPPAGPRSRIVILHALGSRLEAGCFAVLAQGFPQLVRVSSDMVKPDNSALDEHHPLLCRVRMLNETPQIPDFERIESMIADETRVLPSS